MRLSCYMIFNCSVIAEPALIYTHTFLQLPETESIQFSALADCTIFSSPVSKMEASDLRFLERSE